MAEMQDDAPERERRGRYELRGSDDGTLLECHDSPGITARVDPGLGFSEAEARKLGTRVILLDGAGQFGPLYDNEQQLYNLDHHRGCVRSITLSTCEQAMLLVVQGLPLDDADWTVIASTPDLDTLLSLWVLLNHRRIGTLPDASRDVLLPLLRMEGAIDANGAELARYCGLPDAVRLEAEARLVRLQGRLRELSEQALEPSELTVAMLIEIDRTVFGGDTLPTLPAVEHSYGHVDLGDGQVAVVCRDGSGIYAVEPRLKERWGQRLGMIALENAPGQYTLRRISVLKPLNLERAYERLNLVDPAVDGRPPEKCWGGSDDIGGSPRPGGSALGARSLLATLRELYDPAAMGTGRGRALRAGVVVGLLTLLAIVASALVSSSLIAPPVARAALELGTLSAVLWLGARLLVVLASRSRSYMFGLRRPAHGWPRALLLTPVLAALAWLGAGWMPPLSAQPPPDVRQVLEILGAIVLAQVAVETAFRGMAHGFLLFSGPISDPRSRWRLSRATLLSSLLFAALTFALSGLWLQAPALPLPGIAAGAALVAGLILGLLRERTGSIWPGALVQALAASGAAAAHVLAP